MVYEYVVRGRPLTSADIIPTQDRDNGYELLRDSNSELTPWLLSGWPRSPLPGPLELPIRGRQGMTGRMVRRPKTRRIAENRGRKMESLRMIWKWLCELWVTKPDVSFRVDTHKWENKMETLRLLSSARR